jgi:hypothetical protein
MNPGRRSPRSWDAYKGIIEARLAAYPRLPVVPDEVFQADPIEETEPEDAEELVSRGPVSRRSDRVSNWRDGDESRHRRSLTQSASIPTGSEVATRGQKVWVGASASLVTTLSVPTYNRGWRYRDAWWARLTDGRGVKIPIGIAVSDPPVNRVAICRRMVE